MTNPNEAQQYTSFMLSDYLYWMKNIQSTQAEIENELVNMANVYPGLLIFEIDGQNVRIINQSTGSNEFLNYRSGVYLDFFTNISRMKRFEKKLFSDFMPMTEK